MEAFENEFSYIASVIGDRARAIMLWNLLDGRAYTATELAYCADVSPQSASNHLAKLVEAGILSVVKQGRHRYYTFRSPEVAHVIEAMANLTKFDVSPRAAKRPQQSGFTQARTCYDHLAGKLGVSVTEAMVNNGILTSKDKQFALTTAGEDWFKALGIDIASIRQMKRSFAHQCLDWSERKHHLAGALGASLLNKMLNADWLRKVKNSRNIVITPKGQVELRDRLGIEV